MNDVAELQKCNRSHIAVKYKIPCGEIKRSFLK